MIDLKSQTLEEMTATLKEMGSLPSGASRSLPGSIRASPLLTR